MIDVCVEPGPRLGRRAPLGPLSRDTRPSTAQPGKTQQRRQLRDELLILQAREKRGQTGGGLNGEGKIVDPLPRFRDVGATGRGTSEAGWGGRASWTGRRCE